MRCTAPRRQKFENTKYSGHSAAWPLYEYRRGFPARVCAVTKRMLSRRELRRHGLIKSFVW
jgi:hypothetical protein